MSKMCSGCMLLILLCCNPSLAFVCDPIIHCETSLNIDYRFTMLDETVGPVTFKDGKLSSIQNETEEIPLLNVITADGYDSRRGLIVVNGSMPGPDIVLYQNQTITIIVHNNLLHEAVAIHWHGVDQELWPYMDGVAFVTQCPILPGQSFNYTFKPQFGGTYWYHSHMGAQRDMGLYGAFIVLRESDKEPWFQQHILQLQEWNHLHDVMEILNINNGINKEPQSILINGRGNFENNMAPLSNFTVEKQKLHRFRLIGVGSKFPLLFSVSGHKLTVIETDGFEIKPIEIDKIIIHPAERYDVILNLTNTRPGIYNISISLLRGPLLNISDVSGLAYLNVTGGDVNDNDHLNQTQDEIRILNCPFKEYPHQNNVTNVTCIPVSSLTSSGSQPVINYKERFEKLVPPTEDNMTYFLNFGFPGGISSVNGHQFVLPHVSSISQPSEIGNPCTDCEDEKICRCSYSLDLKYGITVTMVLLNLGSGALIQHPIHMHGHTFKVLKMGFPTGFLNGTVIHNSDIKCSDTLPNDSSYCNNARWRNSTWNDDLPDANTDDPVQKDTIIVPLGGYVVIQIQTYNPGLWFMHCHIDQHMLEGMALMLNESFLVYHSSNLLVKDLFDDGLHKPVNFPKSNSFSGEVHTYGKERNLQDEESGIVSAALIGGFFLASLLYFIIYNNILKKQIFTKKHQLPQDNHEK